MKDNPSSFMKSKAGPNAAGPKYRTADHFKARVFGGKIRPQAKFNPAQFKVQHKG